MFKIKTSSYYLERGFPENLEPAFTGQSTKRKRFLVERRKRILKRSIRKSLRTLVKPFFSAPTPKGVLLPQSKDSFKDGLSQARGNNLQKRGVTSIPTTERGHLLSSFFQRENTTKRFSAKRHAPSKGWRSHSSLQSLHTKDKGNKWKRYKFLFPLHRLKGELSKRESQYGKIELYKKQIQEKKKLAFFYGTMSKNSIKKLVRQAHNLSSAENPPTKGLVILLESRLDVTLFRASFFSSVPMARQWINHNKVTVNQNKVRSPGYRLRGGDCIEVLSPFEKLKERIKGRVAKILPFRSSRKKLVTPSLIESYCSLESLFSKEKSSQTSSIKDKKISTTPPCGVFSFRKNKAWSKPALIENFSLIKDHLQSIWEKSIHSQRLWQRGDQTSPAQNLSFVKKSQKSPPLFSQSTHLSAKMKKKGNKRKILLSGFLQRENTTGDRFPSLKRNRPLSGHLVRQMGAKTSLERKWRQPFTCSTRMHFCLQKGLILFDRLRKKEVQPLDFLNAKQALIQPRNRAQRLAGLQISGIKPLHLEISYKLLTAIFLYSPQKVAYPSNLDLPLIIRSLK